MSEALGALIGVVVTAVAGAIGLIFKSRSEAAVTRLAAEEESTAKIVDYWKDLAQEQRDITLAVREETRQQMASMREEIDRIRDESRQQAAEFETQINGLRRDLAAALIHIRDLRDLLASVPELPEGTQVPPVPDELWRYLWPDMQPRRATTGLD